MSGPIFVHDSEERPLMPIAAACARKLMQQGKASITPHHAFTLIQLAQPVPEPSLRPLLLGVALHHQTAELFLLAEGTRDTFPLVHVIVDLHTDLPRRLRRRAMHRRRRRQRSRYRPPRRYGRSFPWRRARSARSTRQRSSLPYRGTHRPGRLTHLSPTMRWRAQAIARVIAALRRLAPISHVVMLTSTPRPHLPFPAHTPAERRRQLVATYGLLGADGTRWPQCAYCGTIEGTIATEHIIPISRGGTDAWHNLTLACTTCNRRKGDRLPEEAGMVPRFPDRSAPGSPQRATPYIRWTSRLLVETLQQEQMLVLGPGHLPPDTLPEPLVTALTNFAATPGDVMTVVAKPISRPRKQVFTARNYPHATPLRSGLERVGQTIKRRNRVNLVKWTHCQAHPERQFSFVSFLA